MAVEGTEAAAGYDDQSDVTLRLLDAVEREGARSQRNMAMELGIALGLTNTYIKRCIRKGWIKATRAPANRYIYYITPKGLTEKGRLTAKFLRQSFQFYKEARSQLEECLVLCQTRNWRRIALVGVGELAEVTILCAMQYPMTLVGIVDEVCEDDEVLSLNVVKSVGPIQPVDAVIVTDVQSPQVAFERMVEVFGEERVLTIPLLRVARRRRALGANR